MSAVSAAKLDMYSPEGQEVLRRGMQKIKNSASVQDIKRLEAEVKRLRKEVKREPKTIDEHIEHRANDSKAKIREKQHAKESEGIIKKAWDKVVGAFKYVFEKVADGVKWVWDTITSHPILIAMLALLATAVWYYSGPVALGYSAIPEEGAAIVKSTIKKTMKVGPSQSFADAFDTL